MATYVLPPPIIGVRPTEAMIQSAHALLRDEYAGLIYKKSHIAVPPGWTWAVADMLQDLSVAVPGEQWRVIFPVLVIGARPSALVVELNTHAPVAFDAIVEATRRCNNTCGRCGAEGHLCRDGLFKRVYCVICRWLNEARLLQADVD